ncbi:MAG: AAA family ATPase [Patescibacteria group bacterium]|nr:AAA family ATPase [Patescibacteria group bacterium]MDD4695259.1 AAA family ATPase [Patescibacteria group bacterium]
MKLEIINKIKNYKSFRDFSWDSFFNSQKFHNTVNIFYGENGSGKSSICNVLKSVCNKKSFINNQIPDEICLKFNDGDYKFSNELNTWDKYKNSDDFLFFDREFVHNNIHLGNTRKTDAEGQEQKSGKMIIEFDGKAIELRKLKNSLKKQISKSEENEPETLFDQLKSFREEHKDTLNFSLLDNEESLFTTYKDKTKKEITKIKKEFAEERKEIEKKLETDKATQKQVNNIQNSISEINNEENELSLSGQSDYQLIFNFDLKEQVQIQAEQDLITKIRQHKDFFQTGIEIREEYKNKCPFCQSKNEEESVEKIIKSYNDIFDDTYQKQLQIFKNNKKILIEELEKIINVIKDYDLNSIFVSLSELNQKYRIRDIYSVDEQKKYKKSTTNKIANLKKKIENLKKPNNENIEEIYNEAKMEFETLETFFDDIYEFIEEKNTLIRKFKTENTDDKIQQRITTNNQKIKEIDLKITFLNEKKIEKQKQKEAKEKDLAIIQKRFEILKAKHDKVKEDYEKYCSEEVFNKTLKKIEEYFDKFKFNFKLKLKTEKTRNKTELPFAFKVLDNEKNERDFKEGLSEGELQVLSLCFFFAFLDIQIDPQNKILIFDDPITSLDNNNLSHLVELITEKHTKFSQTFIFTHHRTFFKFLRSKFNLQKKPNKKASEYYIFRNKKDFGGSFICPNKVDNIKQKLKNLDSHISQESQNGGISEESLIIEYGQYLRYEIENYIKNDLLHINKPNFGNVIDCLVKNKEKQEDIPVEDLKKLKEIYSFCNWTASHVNVGDDPGLRQLKDKINDFINIIK